MSSRSFDLDRFLKAQAPVIDTVLRELRSGRKRSHWMWFVFPQLRGLGHSPTAQLYGIASLDEAQAYYAHPVLGPRLAECTDAALGSPARSANELFGSPDDMKFGSCMTLFEAATSEPRFGRALDRWYGGRRDARTQQLLAAQN